MKFNTKLKPIECTQEEFNLVKATLEKSSCFANAHLTLINYLLQGKLKWDVENRRTISTFDISPMAYNALNAVMHRYKYLKIV